MKIVNGERIFESDYDKVFSSSATQKDVYLSVEGTSLSPSLT